MDLQLKNKVALVTAASRGLGYATAREMAREGADIALCARTQADVEAAAQHISESFGVQVLPHVADVTIPEDIDAMVDATAETFGRIDALFINAGGPPPGGFLDLQPEDWKTASELTVQSAINLAYAVVPLMQANGGGSILANTSVSVRYPLDNLILSNSLRLAVIGLVKSLALELGPDQIRVNAIAPGWTRTERVDQLLENRAQKSGTTPESEAQTIAEELPLRRMAEPEEFGRVASFLLSPAASYITGVTLLVDGGMARAVP
jgi:3-oxoacyl-[acyl-carrier protein] reductase